MQSFDFKDLTSCRSHDPYNKHPVVSSCDFKCIPALHREFFDYMHTQGYDKYVSKSFLANMIKSFGAKLVSQFKQEQDLTRDLRELKIAPDLTE